MYTDPLLLWRFRVGKTGRRGRAMEGTRLSELDPKRNEKAWRERERERERRETNGRKDDKKLSSELDSWSEGERGR